MGNEFLELFLDWYLLTNYLCLVIGIYFFLKLPKSQRIDKRFWLPFLILSYTVFYESMGLVTRYYSQFNRTVNELLGNTEFPGYNLWVFNITNTLVATVLYLFLIRFWIPPTKKRFLTWMIYGFIIIYLVFQFIGIEPIYLDQPMLFAISANLILIACSSYFIQMMTDPSYLEVNPIRLLSFWQVTILLFTYSLTYIYSVSLVYLYNLNPEFTGNLANVNMILGILNQSVLIVMIASPRLPKLFDQEPYE